MLAGLIYGPSAISLEYALSFHGLIPERVETVTRICFKKDKIFKTPVGLFSFRYLKEKCYAIGIEHHCTKLGNFLMASPEKALCDLALSQKLENEKEALDYCLDNLRIDPKNLLNLDGQKLKEISRVYKKISIQKLVEAILLYQNNKMNEAIKSMLKSYNCQGPSDYKNEMLKVKLEIDTDPPNPSGQIDVLFHNNPIPFSYSILKPSSLYSGKIHAILCRAWKGDRIKGRDYYDFIWYRKKI